MSKTILKRSSAGNVLFLILIAVALFAALSYAVINATRSGSSNISSEKAISGAAALVQHLATIRQAIDRMKLTNGCQPNQFNFTSYYALTNNSNSPPDKSCHLYDVAGGGVSPVTFSRDYFDQKKLGSGNLWNTNYGTLYNYRVSVNPNNRWLHIGTHNAGEASVDLMGQVYGISDDICKEINRQLNVNPPTYAPQTYNQWVTVAFYGAYTDSNVFIFPHSMGCIYNSTYQANFLIYPFIER